MHEKIKTNWVSIRKSNIDRNGAGTLTERKVEMGEVIGECVSTRRDKIIRKDDNIFMHFYGECYGNFPYDYMEQGLGFGMKHVNDKWHRKNKYK